LLTKLCNLLHFRLISFCLDAVELTGFYVACLIRRFFDEHHESSAADESKLPFNPLQFTFAGPVF
jgi:hypothetical protein